MGRPLLLFDADCAFCTRAAAVAPKLHLDLDVRPLQEADLGALGISVERALREIPLIGPDGRVRYGHEAIAGALATGRRGSRLAGRIMLTWPISRLAALVYRLVGELRHRLPGGSADCRITPANQPGSAPCENRRSAPPR